MMIVGTRRLRLASWTAVLIAGTGMPVLVSGGFSHMSVLPYDPIRASNVTVSHLHVVWSNHFDAGFDDTSWFMQNCSSKLCTGTPFAHAVLQNYFDKYIPEAMAKAAAYASRGEKYRWMTQQWVLDLFFDCPNAGIRAWASDGHGALLPADSDQPLPPKLLRCPNASAIAAVRDSVARGEIFFHAFPHNPAFGVYDEGPHSLLASGFAAVRRTAADLRVPAPRSLSLRDVPGLTRAILPRLVQENVGFVSLGSGGPSQGHPDIPDLFVWRDPASNASVLFAHDDGYGGGTHVAPNGHALYCAWNRDNSGPIADSDALLARLRAQYPHAVVESSTLDSFLEAVEAEGAEAMAALPTVESEIGDTWAFGMASDPLKLQLLREIMRRRSACLSSGRCRNASSGEPMPELERFDRLLTKLPEHTGGADSQCYFGDNRNWSNVDLAAALSLSHTDVESGAVTYELKNYNESIDSWLEQRSFIPNAIALLTQPSASAPARTFGRELEQAIATLRRPKIPDPGASAPVSQPPSSGEKGGSGRWVKVGSGQGAGAGRLFRCVGNAAETLLSFHSGGGISYLGSQSLPHANDSEGAGQVVPLWRGNLGGFVYQTVGVDDYAAFGRKYGPNFTACNVPPMPGNGNCQERVKLCGGSSSFVKVNVSAGSPERRDVAAKLEELWMWQEQQEQEQQQQQHRVLTSSCQFLVKSSVPQQLHEVAGAPQFVWMNITVVEPTTAGEASLDIELSWVNKAATKLPEALWVRFDSSDRFEASSSMQALEAQKLGTYVDALDVVRRGAANFFPADGMRLHTMNSSTGRAVAATVTSLDASIVGIGEPWPFPTRDSEMPEGAPHFGWNLFNNIWGTNFVMWYPFAGTPLSNWADGANATFRFGASFAALR